MPGYSKRQQPEGSRPHRILWVEMCEDGTTGGTHQMLMDFARHLDRSRFQLVALFHEMNRFARPLRDLGVEVIDFSTERAAERAADQTRDYLGKIRSVVLATLVRVRLL